MKEVRFYDLVEELKGKSSIIVKNILSTQELNLNDFLIFLNDEIKDLEDFLLSNELKSGQLEVNRLKNLRKILEEYIEEIFTYIDEKNPNALNKKELIQMKALSEELLGLETERVQEILESLSFDRVVNLRNYLFDQATNRLSIINKRTRKIAIGNLINNIDSFLSSESSLKTIKRTNYFTRMREWSEHPAIKWLGGIAATIITALILYWFHHRPEIYIKSLTTVKSIIKSGEPMNINVSVLVKNGVAKNIALELYNHDAKIGESFSHTADVNETLIIPFKINNKFPVGEETIVVKVSCSNCTKGDTNFFKIKIIPNVSHPTDLDDIVGIWNFKSMNRDHPLVILKSGKGTYVADVTSEGIKHKGIGKSNSIGSFVLFNIERDDGSIKKYYIWKMYIRNKRLIIDQSSFPENLDLSENAHFELKSM